MGLIQLSDEKENRKLQESNGKIFLDYIEKSNVNMPANVKIGLFEPNKLILCLEERKGQAFISESYTVMMAEKKVTVIKERTEYKSIPRGYDITYHTKKDTSVTEFELIENSLFITKGEAFQSCREDGFGGVNTYIIPIKSIKDIESSSIDTFGHTRSEITNTEYEATDIKDLSKGIHPVQLHPKENAVQKRKHEMGKEA